MKLDTIIKDINLKVFAMYPSCVTVTMRALWFDVFSADVATTDKLQCSVKSFNNVSATPDCSLSV